MADLTLEVYDYIGQKSTDGVAKSFVIIGDVAKCGGNFQDMKGGLFSQKYHTDKMIGYDGDSGITAGWLFSLKRKDEVQAVIDGLLDGSIEPKMHTKKEKSVNQTVSQNPSHKIGQTVLIEDGDDVIKCKVVKVESNRIVVKAPSGKTYVLESQWSVQNQPSMSVYTKQ